MEMFKPVPPAGVVVEDVPLPTIARYVMAFRKPTHSVRQPFIVEYIGCDDLDHAAVLADRLKIEDEHFLGIWEMGEPLALLLKTEEAPVVVTQAVKRLA